jgi:hypothetical protein
MKTDRVRTTISLPPEIHAVFKRMSDASGISVSRCMGDWLADTGDAAEMITTQLEKARRSPMQALREMRALVAGLGDAVIETDDMLGSLQERERTARSEARTARIARTAASRTGDDAERRPGGGGAEGRKARNPPSSNTGVLVPPVPIKSRGGKSGKLTSSRKKQ